MVKLFKKRRKEILEKFNEAEIVQVTENANFFGVESKGGKQVRGNGVLTLTKGELYFEMWVPKKILSVPLNSIKKVTTTRHHLKKVKFVDLLKIEFVNEEGNDDSVAWWVKEVQEWITKLEGLLK
ncbi:MAG: hypothetical protein EU544_05790 [Promethearchaeota archaeon]|nr:MAG: hypothetical protein EU544_05790 [Candidatus Lokiarchaeota archaeon]